MIFNWKVIALLITLLALNACQEVGTSRTLKLAHTHDTSHPVARALAFLSEKVDEVSGGKLKIEVYPSAQLGAERECIELLQIGSLAMTKVSSAVMEGFAPNFKVLGLPYMFRDKAHQHKLQDGTIGKQLLVEGEQYWLRGLCFYDAGSRSFYSKEKPIETPDDLQGMKIRVMKSNTAMNMVRKLGGSPTPISYGELYTALQQGVVDGAENNPPSFYFSRHYEVCKYYTINEHTSVPDVLLMSTVVWNSLNEQEQKWLEEAVQASVKVQRKLWAESEKASLDSVRAAGVTVNYPEKEPFAEKVQSMFDEYKEDKEVYNLIQQIQAIN